MNPWLNHKEVIEKSATVLFESKVDEVVTNAAEDPENSLKLEESEKDELIQVIIDETEGIQESVVDASGSDGDSGASESTLTAGKVATAFFVLAVVQRAMDRTHGAVIARQRDSDLAPEADKKTLDEAVDSAVALGKSEISYVSTNEAGTSYGEIVKEHHESLGDTAYVWNTTFNNSRQTHIDNHLKEFEWNEAPATGHPGHEPNCQCWVSRPSEEQFTNIREPSMQNFKSLVENDTLKLSIMGVIVESQYWDDEVGAIEIIKEIENYKGNKIDVSIYTRGGDAFAGSAIKSALQNHPAHKAENIIGNIYGLAASAGTTVAGGCNKIIIGETDNYLIHNASTVAWGDSKTFRRVASDLETLNNSIAFGWSKRTGKSADEIHALMDEDKYLTAQEAVEIGLADEIRTVDGENEFSNCVGSFCAQQSILNGLPKEAISKYNVVNISTRIGQKEDPNIRQKSESQIHIRRESKAEISNSADSKQITEESAVNLDEAKAKISILENKNTKLLNQIESLEENQAGDDLRETVRNEVREELKNERLEMDKVLNVLNESKIEAEGDSAAELKRNALINQKVDGAAELADESVSAVFDFLVSNKKKEISEEESKEAGAAFTGASNSQDKGSMSSWKVGEK